MKSVVNVFFILGLTLNLYAQVPTIQWQKTYGGTEDDEAYSIFAGNINGFIVVGYSESDSGDVGNHHMPPHGFVSKDVWLLKLDTSGIIEWEKSLGGIAGEEGNSFVQTFDGGFVICGYTNSDDGDVVGLHAVDDFWIVKTDSSGNLQWQNCLGGNEVDEANDIILTSDSGYIVVGSTLSSDGDVTNNNGLFDVMIVKLNPNGIKQWVKCFGGSDWDEGMRVKQTRDGGFIIAGITSSTDGDVSGFHGPLNSDTWVVKFDSSAHIQWQKCFGGTSSEGPAGIIISNDGGYYILGGTSSNDGDVSNLIGGVDNWLIKIDSLGNVLWDKCFGGIYSEVPLSCSATLDGGIVMSGYASLDDSMVSGTHGGSDEWIIKIDSMGNFEWGKCLGGTGNEKAYSVSETSDRGYIIAGSTTSSDGDVSFNHGKKDVWVVKLAPLGLSTLEIDYSIMEFTIFQSNDQLNLRYFSKLNENAKVILYDVNGKTIFEKNISVNEGINCNQFYCGDIAKGMYVVEINNKNNSLREKVFIE